jgi:NAD/NADP transhydrogenase beta subunit
MANFKLDLASRVLTITDVNDDYVQSFVFIFLSVNSVVNPAQTFQTGTFKVQITDN